MEKRIDRLFPLIDIAPPDGKIDLSELAAWEVRRQYSRVQHMSPKQKCQDTVLGCSKVIHGMCVGSAVPAGWQPGRYADSAEHAPMMQYQDAVLGCSAMMCFSCSRAVSPST